MTKDVIIKISGLQFMEEQEPDGAIELITKGEYYYRNGKHYLKYEEIVEGVDGISNCTVKFHEDNFELLKKGSTNVHMVFESGKKNITYYRTPYGTMLIGLDTNSILVSEKENEIQIEVNYGMDVNYEFLADCHIRISVCPVESVDFKLVD
ncbi:MAG: DUF1934 domain-containing protein [Lachnospiraceae bacterium]|nr:DUF1934 domain-containing protein [Lachnospiraceae bacterium]